MSVEKWAALKAAQADGRELDFWAADDPKCPHCGVAFDVGGADMYRLYEDGDHDVHCPECDLGFRVVTQVVYSFSTDEQEMEEESAP